MISTNRPNGLLGPWICALIGAPNPNMVGGPLSHSTIKRGGDQGSNYEVDRIHCNHLRRNLIRFKVSAASDGKPTDSAVASASPLDIVSTTLDTTAPSSLDTGVHEAAAQLCQGELEDS